MPSQFDLTRFYVVIICNSVFQLDFLTREFQIPSIIVEEKKVSLKKKCFIFIAEINLFYHIALICMTLSMGMIE